MTYAFNTVQRLQVYAALSGLMNFVDSKQQGIIRFIGASEKLAKQMAVLVENATPEVVSNQFKAIVETDIFRLEEHQFQSEIKAGQRKIATWKAYHAIDFIRQGVIEISSDPSRVGTRSQPIPDMSPGYSDVYMEGDIAIFTVGAEGGGGTVLVHLDAGMLTIITNGEIGNLEGDMGAYYLAGVGKTFDYYIINRENVMITQSRVFPDSLLKQKGSEFPWLMTMGKAVELGITCLPDGTYKTNAGHYTGQREAMGFYTGPNGKEMLGASMPFYDSEWTIVVEQEAEELLGPLHRLRNNLIVGIAAILTITLATGFAFVTNVTQPLTNIIGDMVRLMRGDTDIEVHAHERGDEIGDLAKAVEVFRNSMIKNNLVEDELRKLSRAIEHSPYMMFITDTDGSIEYVNPKFTEMTGYSADEVMGRNPRILKTDNTPSDTHVRLWETIKAGEIWKDEIEDRRKDGSSFWSAASIAPVRNKQNEITHFIAIHEDISERKEAEGKIRSAMEHAEIANRAKSDLMANMSHELRTPLNAIIGFSGSIKEEIFGPLENEKYRGYLEDIHQSGEHLLELINDILDVSAIEAKALELQEEEVSISNIIEASIRIIRPRAEQGHVTVTSSHGPEMPLVCLDPRRVKQVLLNLLSNSVKFTPEGGEVSVTSWLNDDGSIAVSVADTGIGMDEKEIRTALSAFGQVDSGLDRKQEGVGLGLPLTKGLMEMHGGTLQVKSQKRRGTTITVTFPKERIVRKAYG